MSMRIGDESGRARAEAIDPTLLAPVRSGRPQEGSEWRARVASVPPPHARHGRARGARRSCSWPASWACTSRRTRTRSTCSNRRRDRRAAHWFGTDELSRDIVVAGAPRRPDLVEGRARRGVALHTHRRGDRRVGRLLPRLARRPAHALHRPLDRAACVAVPRGGGVDRHRSTSARSARSTSAARSASPCCCRVCCGVRSRASCVAQRCRCASGSSSTLHARSARRTRASSLAM